MKIKPWRSEQYRRYVASFPCAECSIEGYSQAAHANYGKGKGTKVSDALTFPLCGPRYMEIGCHARLDQLIGMTREQRRERERIYVEKMQKFAKRDGWKLPDCSSTD